MCPEQTGAFRAHGSRFWSERLPWDTENGDMRGRAPAWQETALSRNGHSRLGGQGARGGGISSASFGLPFGLPDHLFTKGRSIARFGDDASLLAAFIGAVLRSESPMFPRTPCASSGFQKSPFESNRD